MRKIIALLTIFSLNAYAVAPTGVGGEQGALSYTNNLKAPNYQVTSLGGVNSRIESGNTNLLMNPSFEHTTVYTGWTINGGTAPPFTNATVTENITNQVEGKKAISIAPSAALTFGQDSTVNAANLTGLQGVASVKIKATGTTGLKVCPRNAGSVITNLCVNVTADNTWKHISIPFILGVTSNGIGIATTATGGTVIIDDAFVGTSAPFQDVSGARLVGTVTMSNCSAPWTTTATSFADFSTKTLCTYSVTGLASAPSTNIPAIKFSSLPAGDYKIEYEGFIYSNGSTSTDNFFRFFDGANATREQSNLFLGSANQSTTGISHSISYSTSQSNITLSLQGKVSSGGSVNVYGTAGNPGTIRVWYFPPASKIYSQASQDYDWTAYTPTFSAGFGTVTNPNCFHQRRGHNLFVKCFPTSGTTAASIGAISLPSGLTIDSNIIKATNTTSGPGQIVGLYNSTTGGSNNLWIVSALGTSNTNVYLGGVLNGATPLTPVNVGSVLANTTQFSFEFSVPIQGWSDYGVIVGSFAGIEKCANDYECTDTFSAQVSATGVVSNESLDWINGNCSNPSASNYTCTFNTNLKDGTSGLSSAMNCVVTRDQATAAAGYTDPRVTSTTTGLTVALPSPVSTNINQPFSIKCQKGSQDYKAKSGKIATTTGVNYVPGAGAGELYDSFSVSYAGSNAGNPASWTNCTTGTCNIDQIGTAVSSVVWNSAGSYTLNLSKTYSKLKCAANSTTVGTGYQVVSQIACVSCSSLTFATGSAANTAGTLVCQGKY